MIQIEKGLAGWDLSTVYIQEEDGLFVRYLFDESGIEAMVLDIDSNDSELLEKFIFSRYAGWRVVDSGDPQSLHDGMEIPEIPNEEQIDTMPFFRKPHWRATMRRLRKHEVLRGKGEQP